MTPPAGFSPIFRVSPVIEMIGPVYSRGEGLELELGMYAQPKHCNMRGAVHGGILATLADMALGYTLAFPRIRRPVSSPRISPSTTPAPRRSATG
jgi:acyl-coenzyme A thioesterase 13